MRSPKQTEVVPIRRSGDIVTARQKGRELAVAMGFSLSDATLIATAISELSRNMVLYANGGEVHVQSTVNGLQRGITIVAVDKGPGIQDLRRALAGGYSTSGGLGLGLSGVRRLMDVMDVVSDAGSGTVVTATMWLR